MRVHNPCAVDRQVTCVNSWRPLFRGPSRMVAVAPATQSAWFRALEVRGCRKELEARGPKRCVSRGFAMGNGPSLSSPPLSPPPPSPPSSPSPSPSNRAETMRREALSPPGGRVLTSAASAASMLCASASHAGSARVHGRRANQRHSSAAAGSSCGKRGLEGRKAARVGDLGQAPGHRWRLLRRPPSGEGAPSGPRSEPRANTLQSGGVPTWAAASEGAPYHAARQCVESVTQPPKREREGKGE